MAPAPNVKPQIWIVNEVGLPVLHLSKQDPFSVVVVVPDTGQSEGDGEVTLEVGGQSTTLVVPFTGRGDGIVQYRIENQRLDDDEVLFDADEHSFWIHNGESITIARLGPNRLRASPTRSRPPSTRLPASPTSRWCSNVDRLSALGPPAADPERTTRTRS